MTIWPSTAQNLAREQDPLAALAPAPWAPPGVGAVLDLPTVGVTDDPLRATGDEPAPAWASRAPLLVGAEVVGYRVRSRGTSGRGGRRTPREARSARR